MERRGQERQRLEKRNCRPTVYFVKRMAATHRGVVLNSEQSRDDMAWASRHGGGNRETLPYIPRELFLLRSGVDRATKNVRHVLGSGCA